MEISRSSPMINMNKLSPIVLMAWRLGRLESGNTEDHTSGKTAPKRLGPKNIPAIISPTTAGCPTKRIKYENTLEREMIMMI
jgi:hypothetical protein